MGQIKTSDEAHFAFFPSDAHSLYVAYSSFTRLSQKRQTALTSDVFSILINKTSFLTTRAVV